MNKFELPKPRWMPTHLQAGGVQDESEFLLFENEAEPTTDFTARQLHQLIRRVRETPGASKYQVQLVRPRSRVSRLLSGDDAPKHRGRYWQEQPYRVTPGWLLQQAVVDWRTLPNGRSTMAPVAGILTADEKVHTDFVAAPGGFKVFEAKDTTRHWRELDISRAMAAQLIRYLPEAL